MHLLFIKLNTALAIQHRYTLPKASEQMFISSGQFELRPQFITVSEVRSPGTSFSHGYAHGLPDQQH